MIYIRDFYLIESLTSWNCWASDKKIDFKFLYPISACGACAWILNFEIDEPSGKKGKNSFWKEGHSVKLAKSFEKS